MKRAIPASGLLLLFLCFGASGFLAGCNSASQAEQKPTAPVLRLASEDIVTLNPATLASGPTITGSIQPERRADLRAEISALVTQVLRENGDPVRRGDPLVRLDETAIRDALASAEAASRAASLSFDQSIRQLERLQKLRTSGMASAQALEDAETRRNNAQSDLEAAKSRVVSARQQLARTTVRAPFDGIVSDRRVSAGDTAQIGKELLKVIDPASKRFEGVVSADHIGAVQVGQAVRFRVNGYADQPFEGRVQRVNPAVNAATRQVEVLVEFVGTAQPKLTGLYAEGNILAESREGLILPAASLLREGDRTLVWVIRDGKVRKQAVTLGPRDPRSGDFPLLDGLAAGDHILRHPSALIADGQAVEQAAPAAESGGKS